MIIERVNHRSIGIQWKWFEPLNDQILVVNHQVVVQANVLIPEQERVYMPFTAPASSSSVHYQFPCAW
jgi:hypothetical protein